MYINHCFIIFQTSSKDIIQIFVNITHNILWDSVSCPRHFWCLCLNVVDAVPLWWRWLCVSFVEQVDKLLGQLLCPTSQYPVWHHVKWSTWSRRMEILLMCHRLSRHCFGRCSVKQIQFVKNTVLWDVMPCELLSHPLRQYCSQSSLWEPKMWVVAL
jgi:hypothetical protein